MPRILVTGASSGIGRAISAHFLGVGWRSSMRHPSAEGLPISDKLRLLSLDVTDADDLDAAIAQAGRLDALATNAPSRYSTCWKAPRSPAPRPPCRRSAAVEGCA